MRIKQFPGFGFNGITKIQQYLYLVIDYDYNTVIPLNTTFYKGFAKFSRDPYYEPTNTGS